jgi:hypothetical protein
VLLLGGVDTWKMEIHRLAVAAAQPLGARVATVDLRKWDLMAICDLWRQTTVIRTGTTEYTVE